MNLCTQIKHNLNFQEGLHNHNPGLTDGPLREATVQHLQSGQPQQNQHLLCSVFSNSLQPQGLVSHQASLSMEFSRQECWSGLPCPSPGDLSGPGTEPVSFTSPALAGSFFTTSTTWAGSSVHGILQARILEWVVISFARGPSQPRDQTHVS